MWPWQGPRQGRAMAPSNISSMQETWDTTARGSEVESNAWPNGPGWHGRRRSRRSSLASLASISCTMRAMRKMKNTSPRGSPALDPEDVDAGQGMP